MYSSPSSHQLLVKLSAIQRSVSYLMFCNSVKAQYRIHRHFIISAITIFTDKNQNVRLSLRVTVTISSYI